MLGLALVVEEGAVCFLHFGHFQPACNAFIHRTLGGFVWDLQSGFQPSRVGEVSCVVEAVFPDLGKDRPALVVRVGDGSLVDLGDVAQRLSAAFAFILEGDPQKVAIDVDAFRQGVDTWW
ncbi:hypothetical protein D3C77_415880 [compost metagenome]